MTELSEQLDKFLTERCYIIPGAQTRFCDFVEEFRRWVGSYWSTDRITVAVDQLIKFNDTWRDVVRGKSYYCMILGNFTMPQHKYIKRRNKLHRVLT